MNRGLETSNTEPTNGPVDSGGGLDDFTERLRTADGVDQDLATIVAENWQKVLGLLVCMLLVIWIIEEYKDAQAAKIEDASSKFAAIQNAYSSSAEEDSVTIMSENIKVLDSAEAAEFYSLSAPLYAARAAMDSEDLAAANDILDTIDLSKLFEGKIPASDEKLTALRLRNEAAALLKARVLVAKGELKDARSKLLALSKSGTFTTVESLLVLLRIAETTEQRDAVVAAAEEIRIAKPEYAETIVFQFQDLGVTLEN